MPSLAGGSRAVVLTLLLVALPLIAPAATISVLPGSQVSVAPATTTTIVLNISGLGSPGSTPHLGTFDITLSFNPLLLTFTGATYGTGLDVFGLGDLQSTTPAIGTVNLLEISLDSPTDLNTFQSNSFMLVSLQFLGITTGQSDINLTVNALGDANGAALAADIIYGTGIAIPEPSSRSLLVGSVMLLLALGFRRSGLRKRA
jgi:hypothetical protein